MTEKRFTHKDKSLYIDDDYFCELEDGDEITELLNRQQYTVETVWNENEQLKQKYDNSVMLSAKIQVQNDELRERNNRQAETIDNLYSLIENKDWKGLTKLIDEMNEAEELNQLEFQAYCDGDIDD